MRRLLRRLVTIGVKPTDEVKAVFFFQKHFADIAGVDEAEERQEDLCGAAEHLDVLVVQQAAADCDHVVVLECQPGVEHWRHQAARPVLHPPRAVQGGIEGHDEVSVLRQVPNLQVEADDEGVPADPQHQPHRVHDEVFGSVLDGPEDAQDDSHDV